ncbi:MAG: hypothetical protein ACK55O_11500 [Phycisphaerales bacterium]|nr:hypothetical protein [Phycisphaeraceae bacterium]
MNPNQLRPLIPEFCIAAALLSGLWLGVLAPRERELAEQRRAEDDVRQRVSAVTTHPGRLDEKNRELNALGDRVIQLERRAAMLADESEAFTQFMSLGERLGVRIDQVTPTTPAVPTGAASSASDPAAAGADSAPKDRRLGFDMSIRGSFPAVVAFVEALQRDLGFVHIRMLRVSPPVEAGSTVVTAEIGCDVLVPDLTPIRRVLSAATPEADR